ncbi:MAG TPA: methionine synthase [Symbiobacteriaceae bacterium]|nr:methionine synthase [Symbiobacteriaceae bacterium]
MSERRRVLGAAIGDCVHVGGVVRFLQLAEQVGSEIRCLGPAVSIDQLIAEVQRWNPEIVAVGYRLTPESGRRVLAHLAEAVRQAGLSDRRWVLGATDPVAETARELGFFEAVFGSSTDWQSVVAFLRGETARAAGDIPPQTLVERIRQRSPFPLLRHHYGQPTVAATVAGIRQIAAAGVLDVISLGTDQNAQEHFFRPEEMDPREHGAGGVPVRTREDLAALKSASRTGNFPLMRCYAGTRDQLRWAAMLSETVGNAWCAIPLFWYSQLDGRSERPLTESIPEVQAVMQWHGQRGIPLESNESHHWSLRDAPDTVAVAAAYLAAYNARRMGVQDYVQQLMWNNPPLLSPAMDLAKMLAKLDLVEGLTGPEFRVWRECRAGLTSMPAGYDRAKGHLAATTFLQMMVRPHILHIVGASEFHHAATAQDVIDGCHVVAGAINLALQGLPDMTADPAVQARRRELVREAGQLIDAITHLAPDGVEDPLTDAATLARAVQVGLLDAPHLLGNPAGRGQVAVRFDDGACRAFDRETGKVLSELERQAGLRLTGGVA